MWLQSHFTTLELWPLLENVHPIKNGSFPVFHMVSALIPSPKYTSVGDRQVLFFPLSNWVGLVASQFIPDAGFPKEDVTPEDIKNE